MSNAKEGVFVPGDRVKLREDWSFRGVVVGTTATDLEIKWDGGQVTRMPRNQIVHLSYV